MAGRRFRIVRQKDAMQCGVASLAMICQHHGGNYSTTFLDTLCHATTEGVSMLGIANAANSLGMQAAATRTEKVMVK